MNKKPPQARTLVALALAALPAAAFAQSANVTMYGTLFPNVDVVETRGATTSVPSDRPNLVPASAYTGINQPSRARMTGSISNWGFRGEEDLGGGLKAWFQIESSIGVDGEPPSTLAGRNTGAGFSGPWGTFLLGQWDTPYKLANIFMGTLRGSFQWEASNLMNTPGFNVPVTTTQSGRVNGKADAAFNRRQGNSIQYWTPNVAGFTGRIAYSVAEGKTAASATNPGISPDLWSALVTYQNGGLRLDYMHERHNDYFGLAQLGGAPGATLTNSSSADYGNELIAAYRYQNVRFVAGYERLVYGSDESVAGNVRRFEKGAWWVSVQPRFGAHQVWVSYGQADKGKCEVAGGGSCSTSGLDGKQFAVGWSYSFSKRTEVYSAYYEVRNGTSAQYTTWPALFAAPGADTRGFDVGILHSF